MLIGKEVWVELKIPGLRVFGTFYEFYESNNTIVLRDYEVWRLREGKWEQEEKGELIIIKGDAWAEIKVPKL